MFTEDQLLPISALQHLIFCERQCALIHVERLWAENRWTIEGQHLHEKAHTEQTRTEKGLRVARGLQLQSMRLGLAGQADVVEFHQLNQGSAPSYKVVPIEYKRGKAKKDDSDRVQLCAQALCLEEMTGTSIEHGFLFYGKTKRRLEVPIGPALRDRTTLVAARLHQMISNRETPSAVREPKCDQCSLVELCLPDAMRFKTGAAKYLERELAALLDGTGPVADEFETKE